MTITLKLENYVKSLKYCKIKSNDLTLIGK